MSAPAWRNRIISYDTKPASQFTANPLNWRTHPSVQREALRGLLGDVGWVGAVLENKQTGNLIDGHARIEEALSEDSTQLIPYLLVDLTPEEEKLVLASFDPISALATADSKRLEELLKGVSSSSQAVDSMLSELAKEHGVLTTDEPKDAEPQIDKAAELQQKWSTETGQLWVIGNHRLLVGDATNKADVGRLCAGKHVDMVLTDPPYGIDEETDRVFASRTRIASGGRFAKIKGDDSTATAITALALCKDIKVQVWFGANYYCHSLPETGNWLVWDKRVDENERDFNSDCELAWVQSSFNSVRIFRHKWKGLIKDSEQGEARTHPTQKPVALASFAIEEYGGKVKTVLDLFAGTGWVMVAAENSERECLACEIHAPYAATILERMTTAFPHLKIEKVDQARAA